MILNINAQSLDRTSFKISVKDKTESTLKLDQKLMIMKGLHMDLSSQFGNLFMTRFEAKKVGINLKDYYNDFDFGFNIDISHKLRENLNLKAIYNVGMLKFNDSDTLKAESYTVKISINYVF